MSNSIDLVTPYNWDKFALRLRHMQELSPVAGGQVTARDLGSPVWTCEARTPPIEFEAADAMMARFARLRGALFTFLAHDPARESLASLSDPVAIAALAAEDATVASIRADRAALSIGGLPNGVVFAEGDKISVKTGAGGYEYYRLLSGGVSDLGVTPELEVDPPVRGAVQAGDEVFLVRAPLEVRIEPGSLDDPQVSLVHRRVTFKAVQVIR